MKSITLRRLQGFTLIEAMIVLVIMAIILAFGIPAFGDLIDRTRVRSAVESVVEAFRVARLTAVQERRPVKMCALNDTEACSGSNWAAGIMIVKVAVNTGETDEVIYRMRFSEDLYIFKNNIEAKTDEVNITVNGWTPADQAHINICTSAEDTRFGQRIVISGAGKIRTESTTDCKG